MSTIVERVAARFATVEKRAEWEDPHTKRGEWSLLVRPKENGSHFEYLLTDPNGKTVVRGSTVDANRAISDIASNPRDWKGKDRIWVVTMKKGYGRAWEDAPTLSVDKEFWKDISNGPSR